MPYYILIEDPSIVSGRDSIQDSTADTVVTVTDLAALGSTISKRLFDGTPETTRCVVCFQSLTELLEYNALEDVFQFLHLLTHQVRSTDAVAHFYLDPTVHDDEMIRTIKALFDTVVSSVSKHNADRDPVKSRSDTGSGELGDDRSQST
jgi:hypothetical protein